jgi:hypothetical protein
MSGSQGVKIVNIWSVSQNKYLRVHDSTGELTPDQDKPGPDTAFIYAWKAYGSRKYIAFHSFSRQKWLQVDEHSNNRVTATAQYQSGTPVNAAALFWLQAVDGVTSVDFDPVGQTKSALFGIVCDWGGAGQYSWGVNPDDDYKVYGDRNSSKIDSHNHLQFQMEYATAETVGGPLAALGATA